MRVCVSYQLTDDEPDYGIRPDLRDARVIAAVSVNSKPTLMALSNGEFVSEGKINELLRDLTHASTRYAKWIGTQDPDEISEARLAEYRWFIKHLGELRDRLERLVYDREVVA
jgi:hypothetical protein